MKQPKRYLMVCLGNICRSPMAEGILKEKLKKIGSNSIVESRGFERYHEGDPADSRAQKVMKQHGIDISSHRARLFKPSDFDNFDIIFVMDESNYIDVCNVARNENDLKKVDFIMKVVDPTRIINVPDPYYGGEQGFLKVWEMLDLACDKIIEKYEK